MPIYKVLYLVPQCVRLPREYTYLHKSGGVTRSGLPRTNSTPPTHKKNSWNRNKSVYCRIIKYCMKNYSISYDIFSDNDIESDYSISHGKKLVYGTLP